MRIRASLVAGLSLVTALTLGCSKKNEVAVGQACTTDEECTDDGNACTFAKCQEGTCLHNPVVDDTAVDGGGRCWNGEVCQGCFDGDSKLCVKGDVLAACGKDGAACADCDDKNDCTEDACSEDSKACEHDNVPPGDAGPADCLGGSCWEGTCCGGCWNTNASQCVNVQNDPAACGLGGFACNVCEDDNPCTTNVCDGGVCDYPDAQDGTGCPGGQCYEGACCDGCWDGNTCPDGTAVTACGAAGAACVDCTPSNPCQSSSCTAGACSAPVDLDGVPCPEGVCVLGQCECGALGQPCCASGTSCENALACSQGTCGDCGAASEPCCPPNDSCSAGNICQSGDCTPCGTAGQPCCTGSSCQGQTVCQTDQCVACGGANQPCCGGTSCDAGNNCSGGTCTPCGALSQACCSTGTACAAADTVCDNGNCSACGAVSEPCCSGSVCDTWAACSAGSCTACGRAGQDCCPSGTACDAYLSCSAGDCLGCIVQMSNGSDHRCAVRSDGTLWCWGQNSAGQLGTGDTGGKGTPTQITSQGTGAVAQVAAGTSRTAVRKADGTVWNLAVTTSQINLGVGWTALEIAAGGDMSCARVTDGAAIGIRCWTSGSTPPSTVTLPGSRIPAHLAVGGHHACTAATDGTAWCWGQNEAGQLGKGSASANEATPVQVTWLSGNPTVTKVAAGNSFSCAITGDQKAWCWGSSTDYQVGTGSNGAINPYPAEVTALGLQVSALAAGRAHACARLTTGALWCWGSNAAGQAGPGGANPMQTPTQVAFFGTSVAALSAGGNESCSVRTDATAWCHGATPAQVPITCP